LTSSIKNFPQGLRVPNIFAFNAQLLCFSSVLGDVSTRSSFLRQMQLSRSFRSTSFALARRRLLLVPLLLALLLLLLLLLLELVLDLPPRGPPF
jgi:hypothetical protein